MYLYSGSTGFANAGKTALRLSGTTGTFNVGNTVSYYDTDGVTVLASGTIASKDTDGKLYLTGKVTGLQIAPAGLGKTIVAHGNAQLNTSVKKYGTASLSLDGTGDYATVASTVDFAFGTGAWTIECWIYRSVSGAQHQILDFRTIATQNAPRLYITSANILGYYVNGAARITGGTVSSGTWHHVAISKNGTSTKLFLDGVQTGSTYTDTTNYIQSPLTIGAQYDGSGAFNGYIDEIRVSKGVARYTTTFTPLSTEFVKDQYTVLLLHLNGASASTTFVDETILVQDIRNSTNGATATKIDLVDYSDFGVEVRAIGSATVYGNYGVYGTGVGVVAYLIGHNLAYIGAGKRSDNDVTYVVQDNEITEAAGAKVYYSSVDHKGDFRIGDLFYVNQQDGTVQFTSASLNIQSTTGVTFTNGANTTYIDGVKIETGNLRLTGNTFSSTTGPINITSANDQINFTNNVNIAGNLDVVGNVTIGGNIQVGDQTTDTVSFVAGVDSDLLPSTDNTYDLGSNSLRWKYLYTNEINVGDINISNNTITTVGLATDLVLKASTGGIISIPTNDVEITQDLRVNGTTVLDDTEITGTVTHTGDYIQTGNYTQTGDTNIIGTLTTTGYAQFENIKIDGNTIATTVSGTDLVLDATVQIGNFEVRGNLISNIIADSVTEISNTGSGYFKIGGSGGFVIPTGDTLSRPGIVETGMVRYNTTDGRVEVYTGTYWSGIAGTVGGVTAAEAESLGITSAIMLG